MTPQPHDRPRSAAHTDGRAPLRCDDEPTIRCEERVVRHLGSLSSSEVAGRGKLPADPATGTDDDQPIVELVRDEKRGWQDPRVRTGPQMPAQIAGSGTGPRLVRRRLMRRR